MKIGFVAEPYEKANASGMGYLVMELMRHLVAEGQGHEFVFYSSQPIELEASAAACRTVRIPQNFIKKYFWFMFMREDIDTLFFIAPLLPLSIPKHIRAIVICQELVSQKIKPKRFSDKLLALVRDQLLMPPCLSRARSIIAPSQATKDDIVKFYGIPGDKIAMIYDGFQSLQADEQSALEEDIQPFFFFAGKLKYRKNVHGIVTAFILFKEKTHASCKLVIAGKIGGSYYQELLQDLEKHHLLQDVHFVGYISKAMLTALYSNACAFLFPSFNEGFGMPILEAMSLGTPVITSKISSMAEVAGDAALLVDPFDAEDISKAMEQIFSDSLLRAQLIQKGKERVKLFSWSKTAKEYLSLVQN